MRDKTNKLLGYFNLGEEKENFQTVHSEIEKGVVFRGTNLWILICAILVASVGLNMNSTAVIIGAMLISPLMGPINGMGYSIATYDFSLFKRSFSNFTFAVVVSLITSALYFFISPVDTAHSELLARTSPTIYDVFIALFGGVAGMLAISSKLKGNVIPGVAIATALMPPICTAGYGLASLQFNFFFGALYLFTINTVFIAVASMVVAQLLKFPITSIVDKTKAKQVNHYLTAILVVTLVPSIFFGYRLVQNEKFTENSKKFINKVSVQGGSYLLENKVNATNRTIQLIYSGYGIPESSIKKIHETALEFRLDTSKIKINAGADASVLQQTQKMQTETEMLANQLNIANFMLEQSKARIDSLQNINRLGKTLLTEIKQLYPSIETCSYANTCSFPDTVKKPIVIFTSKRNTLNISDKSKIEQWLQTRLKEKEARVYFE